MARPRELVHRPVDSWCRAGCVELARLSVWGRGPPWKRKGRPERRVNVGIQFCNFFFPVCRILDVAFFGHGVDVVRVMVGAAGVGTLAVGLVAGEVGRAADSLVSIH